MKLAIAVLCLFSFFCSSFGFFGLSKFGNLHKEPPVNENLLKLNYKIPKIYEKFIDQRLDNFNPFDKRTWKMRYLENDEYRKPGGPIMIFLGGEWTISGGRLAYGHLVDMAKEFNGSLYYTEHRYYGKSRPTANTSTENLKYLSIEQALEDVAHFIDYIKVTTPELKDSKVLVSGGSYSATMAVWMRQKYPHLVDAAWSSSAPLDAKVDFVEYKEVMTESLRIVGGDKCVKAFEDGFRGMEEIIDSGDFSKLQKDFNLCAPLEAPHDIPHFMYEVSDLVANLVQSHRPGRIEYGCAFVSNETHSDSVAAIGAWVNENSKECLNMSYWDAVEKFRATDWDAPGNEQSEYQKLCEIGC